MPQDYLGCSSGFEWMDRTEKAVEQLGFQSQPWISLAAEINFLMEGDNKKKLSSDSSLTTNITAMFW